MEFLSRRRVNELPYNRNSMVKGFLFANANPPLPDNDDDENVIFYFNIAFSTLTLQFCGVEMISMDGELFS